MGIMTNFQKKKQADPNHGVDRGKGDFTVIATMPVSKIGKQQAVSAFEKEIESDLAKLKFIRSVKQKESEKAEHLVPKYLPIVETLITAGSAHPLLGLFLVWLFDIKDIHKAMPLALYCIAKKIPMPEWFKRDLPTFLCDAVLDWAEAEFEAGRSVEPYFHQLCEAANDFELVDQITARMHRLKGLIAMAKEDYDMAVLCLQQAEKYGAKVKTALAQAEKKSETAKEV
ncbi:MAG: phage terminase small subunit [Desulforhopalus sp.]